MSEKFFHKLTYNSESVEIRLASTISAIRGQTVLPEDVCDRVSKKIESVRERGEITRWANITERYNVLAEKACHAKYDHFPEKKPIIITLAIGIPRSLYAGTSLLREADKTYLKVSLLPNALKNFSQKSFVNCIQYKAREFDFKANEAQLSGIYNIALSTQIEKIRLIPGSISSNFHGIDAATRYIHIYEKSIDEYILCLLQPEYFSVDEKKRELIHYLENSLKKEENRILRKESILNKIETILCGAEYFGFNLPVTILSTYGRYNAADKDFNRQTQRTTGRTQNMPHSLPQAPDFSAQVNYSAEITRNQNQAALTEPASQPQGENRSEGILRVNISADRLTATIVNFRMAFYNNPDLNLDEDWFHSELKRLKIRLIPEHQLKRALENLRRKRDITGIAIGEGIPPQPAESPYIKPVCAAGAGPGPEQTSAEITAVRKVSEHIPVKSQDHIATIGYKKPATPGKDIFGQAVFPPPPGTGGITWGEGVDFVKNSDFYATRDGSALIKKDYIEVAEALVIENDINLSSGDIDFAGAVEIAGNIDPGATVRTGGNLKVSENICGKSVYAGGSLKNDGGIVTGKNGFLFVDGDISTKFIENSNIICTGDLEVEKTILLSQVKVEGNLILKNPDGRISSSEIYVFGNVIVSNLGCTGGQETVLHLGKYWRFETMMQTYHRRFIRFKKAYKTEKMKFKDFHKQNKGKLTSKKQLIRQSIEIRLLRLERIVHKIQDMLQKLEDYKTVNPHSYAKISGTLNSNTVIILSDDRTVKSTADLAMVAVSCHAKKGRELTDLNTFKPQENTLKPFNRFKSLRRF